MTPVQNRIGDYLFVNAQDMTHVCTLVILQQQLANLQTVPIITSHEGGLKIW